ncbi:hypothetical protein BDR05DRAFT_965181 [Suillus weaverae]|nr:hypothetical protein BDR05DRAFT_965181 [Suillus weaverae]
MRHQQKTLNLRLIVALFLSTSRPRPQAQVRLVYYLPIYKIRDTCDSTRAVAVPSPFKWDVKDSDVQCVHGIRCAYLSYVVQVCSWIDFRYWSVVRIIAWTCLTVEIRQTTRKFSLADLSSINNNGMNARLNSFIRRVVVV